jgi:hypothetical protein
VPPCWPMMSHECSGSVHAACSAFDGSITRLRP